jgi:hypothetical protein
MCNCITVVKFICVSFIMLLFFLSGCATPKHSNTLIFGTNTKFALDVSVDSTGQPSITVGYKRQEAVWMPLLANKEGTPAECRDIKDCTYLYIGKEDNTQDTYSVLASFGAKFSGETVSTSGANVGGGIAQYFATGLAARKLAENNKIAETLSVQPVDKSIMDKYKELYEEAEEKAKKQISVEEAKIELIVNKVAPDGNINKSELENIIGKTSIDKDNKEIILRANTGNDLKEILKDVMQSAIEPLFKAIYEK